jgi:putative transport protein
LGKSLGELNFERTYGAVVTRVTRADVEFAANNQVRLQFGDFLFVVGSNEGVVQVGDLVGNKPKALDQPHVLPVFVGILLGVILGSLPIVLPGMPAAVRLRLAGGPLIVALVLSRVGRIGPLIWYLSPGANLALREIGIVLFLACVGLKTSSNFRKLSSDRRAISPSSATNMSVTSTTRSAGIRHDRESRPVRPRLSTQD